MATARKTTKAKDEVVESAVQATAATLPNIPQSAVISPKEALELGLIAFPDSIPPEEYENYIQQNGIDVTCDTLVELEKSNFILLKDGVARHRDTKEAGKGEFAVEGVDRPVVCFELDHSVYYNFGSNFKIDVKEGYMATLTVRSSLNRNAVLVTSGVWDTGYRGTVGGTIHNQAGITHIEVGARVAQIVFFRADSAKLYDGQYQGI